MHRYLFCVTQNLDVICVSNQNRLRRISPKILRDQFGCMNALDMMNKPLISFHVTTGSEGFLTHNLMVGWMAMEMEMAW